MITSGWMKKKNEISKIVVKGAMVKMKIQDDEFLQVLLYFHKAGLPVKQDLCWKENSICRDREMICLGSGQLSRKWRLM